MEFQDILLDLLALKRGTRFVDTPCSFNQKKPPASLPCKNLLTLLCVLMRVSQIWVVGIRHSDSRHHPHPQIPAASPIPHDTSGHMVTTNTRCLSLPGQKKRYLHCFEASLVKDATDPLYPEALAALVTVWEMWCKQALCNESSHVTAIPSSSPPSSSLVLPPVTHNLDLRDSHEYF